MVTEASSRAPPARGIDELLAVLRDPVAWGERMLVNRDDSQRKYWKHQAEDLRCEADHIIHMDGRDIGKSIALVGHLLHYVFTTQGGTALVAAPHQGQLDALTDELEFQLEKNKDLKASVVSDGQGDMKIKRKPYFKIDFTNGSVIHFRPAGAYGEAFRSLHVDRLYVDEGAWIPERAWKALRMCLKAGGHFRVYSTPNGLRDTTYYRLTKSKKWKLFRWPASDNPTWTPERAAQLADFYGGINSAGWQHEVAGEHGMPSFGAFGLDQVLRALVPIPEYRLIRLSGEMFAECASESEVRGRVDTVLNLPASWKYGTHWLGGDLGYTNDPTELVLLRDDGDTLRTVLRVHGEHVPYPVISELVAAIDRACTIQGIGIDKGGNGLSVVQDLTSLDKFKAQKLAGRVHGIDFGGAVTVGFEGDEPVKKRTKEHMTALIAAALNQRKLEFPDSDTEIEDQFATHTYSMGERHIVYSKGNDHVVDALRCAFLAKDMTRLKGITGTVEEVFLMPLLTDPIF